MEILSLRTFKAVVDEGGIGSASRKLNTVQSNVTSRIKRLEEELGSKLFYRKGRRLELAPSGRVLLDYAERLLHLETEAGAAVRGAGKEVGELRIGAMESFAAFKLPPLLKSLRRHHPGLHLHVQTSPSSALVKSVLNFDLDCAFVGGTVDHPELTAREIMREELVLIRAKESEDGSLPLILFREGCTYRDRALAWKRDCGDQINEIMELGTLDGILGCISMGLGCTLMPKWVVENYRDRASLVTETIPAHIAEVPTSLITRKDLTALPAIETLTNVAARQ